MRTSALPIFAAISAGHRGSLCLAMAIALTACGGPSTQGGTTPVARGPEPCPTPGELRLGRICWSPIGSRWHVTAMAPGGEYAFDVELLAANRLRSTDHPAAGPTTDEWFVDGNTLRLFLANRFVEYRSDLGNGTVMIGEAVNTRGETWEWRGDRMQIGGGCNPDEAALGQTCFAIAGTQWTLHAGGADRVVHFAPEGRLLTDQGGTDGDTWTQQGATVRFTLGGTVYTTTIESETATLAGSGWTAERIELYPPPIH